MPYWRGADLNGGGLRIFPRATIKKCEKPVRMLVSGPIFDPGTSGK
jgi:hypothetical protein